MLPSSVPYTMGLLGTLTAHTVPHCADLDFIWTSARRAEADLAAALPVLVMKSERCPESAKLPNLLGGSSNALRG